MSSKDDFKKVKVKVTSICMARRRERLQRAQIWITQLPANNTISDFTGNHAAPPRV